MKKLLLTIVLAGSAFAAVAVPADACACTPARPTEKQCSVWPLDGGEQLNVVANRHTTCRSARRVGDAWLDDSAWSPIRLSAAGKRWTRKYANKTGRIGRMLEYRNGRQVVSLYWSKYGAG